MFTKDKLSQRIGSMKQALVFPTLALLLTLGGCASLSKQECLNADWYTIGLEDGSRGRALGNIGNHRKACARVDVSPDLAEYQAGHQEGLRGYCTPHQGYRLGQSGGQLPSHCPGDLQRPFQDAYQAGRELRQVQTRLANVNSQIQGYFAELRSTEEQITDLEEAIVGDQSSPAERREHLAQIRKLRESLPLIRDDIDQAELTLGQMETEYQALQNYHRELGF